MLPRGYIEQPRPRQEPHRSKVQYFSHLGSRVSRGTVRQLNGLGTLPLRWILTHHETNHGPPSGRPYGQGLRKRRGSGLGRGCPKSHTS